jgi:RNA polymerase sigma-70 factor, ECF subfamily
VSDDLPAPGREDLAQALLRARAAASAPAPEAGASRATSPADDGDPAALVPLVDEVLARVRAAWPQLKKVDLGRFFAHLGSFLPGAAGLSAAADADLAAAAARGLVVEDLYLAFACASNDALALRAFAEQFDGELGAAYDRFNIPQANRGDARQQLWEKLFVGAPKPRILEYSGRGALRYWFRVTVLRALVDDVRAERRSREVVDDDALLGAASASPDPEIEHLKRLYRREFATAFEEAVRALGAEERNALRSYYTQKLTIDEMAAAFGIHRATAARRVATARERLLTETRRRLADRLSLSSRELQSIFHLIESRLHISVGRLLK